MTAAPKVLLVGSSFSAAPFFFILKKLGFTVTVCGNDKHDPCHAYGDASLFFDYSIKEELLRAANSGDYKFIVPTCNDYSYLSCAWAAEKLGAPGFDCYATTLLLHTKDAFRRFVAENGLPAPPAMFFENGKPVEDRPLNYPLLVKPIDSFSGRGFTRIDNPRDLDAAVATATKSSRSGKAVAEEFLPGSLHSHSAFIKNGTILADFFVDEFCTVYPYQVNCSNHPSRLGEPVRNGMRAAMSKLIKALNLADGLLHTQFLEHNGKFWIVECMRRCPGDLYGGLVARSTGIDYFDLYLRPFIARPLPDRVDGQSEKFIGRHTISSADTSVIAGFSHAFPARPIEIVPLKNSGERMKPAPYDKLGILFAEFDSREALLATAPHFADLVTIFPYGAAR